MAARKKDENLEFLDGVVLPDEGATKGVYIFSGEKSAEFFVAHRAGPRAKRERPRVDISVSRGAHRRSKNVLDLKYLLRESRKNAPPSAAPSGLPETKAEKNIFRAPKMTFNFKAITQKIPRYRFYFSPAVTRALFAFAVISFIFILPIKAFTYYGALAETKENILKSGMSGLEHFQNGGAAIVGADFEAAIREFGSAGSDFEAANNTLGQVGGISDGILRAVPVAGRFYAFGKDLSSLGANLSLAALDLSRGIAAFKSGDNWISRLDGLKSRIDAARPRLAAAELILNSLRGNLREPLTPEKWELLNGAVLTTKKTLQEISGGLGLMADLLGKDSKKRYLFVFQNSNEIRPTGGFMGSFALLDIKRGEVIKLEIPGGGAYDLKGQLRELLEAPKPMRLIASSWQFQDANWWPDFPASARKIMWFYEKSGGPTVDGVIAVNSNFIEKLLQFTGEIAMPDYDKTLTADNFIFETQTFVELEYDRKENKPKQIIADLAPLLISRLGGVGEENLGEFFRTVASAARAKDIQIYLTDAETENRILDFGLGGELKPAPAETDYLAVIDTNIAGQKTDGVIDETIDEKIDVSPDGTIDKTLVISRAHRGVKGTPFSGVRNVDYLRVYVPEGSILLSAEGFEAPDPALFKTPILGTRADGDLKAIESEYFVDPLSGTRVGGEFGKTVFGNWTMVDPGEIARVTIKYRLPFKFSPKMDEDWLSKISRIFGPDEEFLSYKEIVQKQSGARNTIFKSRLNLPKDYVLIARYPSDLNADGSGWNIDLPLDGDKFFGILFRDER